MNAEFYEIDEAQDALFDLFIDQLHQFAELNRNLKRLPLGQSQRIEQLPSKQLVAGSNPADSLPLGQTVH